MKPDELAPADNPFSARHVRPGAIAYHFPPGESAEGLIARLQAAGWRGQILGPHGSGKSTLLAALLPELERRGVRWIRFELHDGQRRLPASLWQLDAAPNTVILVDGYEQLGLGSRLGLSAVCRWKKLGLVVTTHRRCRMPVLFRTQTTPALAEQLACELLAEKPVAISPEEVSRLFAQQEGNLREVLFGLYDLYEQRLPRR